MKTQRIISFFILVLGILTLLLGSSVGMTNGTKAAIRPNIPFRAINGSSPPRLAELELRNPVAIKPIQSSTNSSLRPNLREADFMTTEADFTTTEADFTTTEADFTTTEADFTTTVDASTPSTTPKSDNSTLISNQPITHAAADQQIAIGPAQRPPVYPARTIVIDLKNCNLNENSPRYYKKIRDRNEDRFYPRKIISDMYKAFGFERAEVLTNRLRTMCTLNNYLFRRNDDRNAFLCDLLIYIIKMQNKALGCSMVPARLASDKLSDVIDIFTCRKYLDVLSVKSVPGFRWADDRFDRHIFDFFRTVVRHLDNTIEQCFATYQFDRALGALNLITDRKQNYKSIYKVMDENNGLYRQDLLTRKESNLKLPDYLLQRRRRSIDYKMKKREPSETNYDSVYRDFEFDRMLTSSKETVSGGEGAIDE